MPKLLFYDLSTSQIKATETLLNKIGKRIHIPLILYFPTSVQAPIFVGGGFFFIF